VECKITKAQNWTHFSGLSCEATNLVITSLNIEITSVNGKTTPFEDIKILDIGNETVHYFPRGIEKLLPNIQGIWADLAKLKTISKSDLQQFPKLNELLLIRNDIEEIESDLFVENPEIRIITFYDNNLSYIGKNIFDPLKKLEKVDFEKNICINFNAKSKDEISTLIKKVESNCALMTKNEMKTQKKFDELKANVQDHQKNLNEIIANYADHKNKITADANIHQKLLKDITANAEIHRQHLNEITVSSHSNQMINMAALIIIGFIFIIFLIVFSFCMYKSKTSSNQMKIEVRRLKQQIGERNALDNVRYFVHDQRVNVQSVPDYAEVKENVREETTESANVNYDLPPKHPRFVYPSESRGNK
jgi:hypothetical protein